MDWIRIWIGIALWGCGMVLSLMGYLAAKRQCNEAVDWSRLARSAWLTLGGAILAAAVWPLDGWGWTPGDAVTVLASGFGLNAGLTKGLQVLFPKRG